MRALLLISLTALAFAVWTPARSDTKPSDAKPAVAHAGAKETVAIPSKAIPLAAKSEKQCKQAELRLQPVCKAGAKCAALCLPTPSRAGGLCPDGLRWERQPCPANARCLLGGRCVPPAATKEAGAVPSKTTAKVLTPAAHVAVKCGVGRVPTEVMCIRAPCPTLCLPAHLDPSLKESPKVKPL